MWIPVLESQDFLEYQAQEDQKELWGSLDREVLQVQGAKDSLGWMARGAQMVSLGHLGLQDAKVMLERLASVEHQVLLVPLVILGPKGLVLDTLVASFLFSTVRQIKNLPVLRACPSSGPGTACYTRKDRRKHTIKILVWQGLVFLYLAHCPLPTAISIKCATMPGEMTSPTGWPPLLPFP